MRAIRFLAAEVSILEDCSDEPGVLGLIVAGSETAGNRGISLYYDAKCDYLLVSEDVPDK